MEFDMDDREYHELVSHTRERLRKENVDPGQIDQKEFLQSELYVQNSHLREVRQSLERREKLLEALFERAPVGYLLLDRESRVVSGNRASRELLGNAGDRISGIPAESLFSGRDRDDFVSARDRARETGKRSRCEVTLTREGEKRPLSVEIVCVDDLEEAGGGWLMGLSDISHVRAVQESLRRQELLLRETHHRVKNNFQYILGLLQMEQSKGVDPHTDEVLSSSQAHLATLAALHDSLQNGGQTGLVNLSDYLESVLRALTRVYKLSDDDSVTCEIEPQVNVSMNAAVACGLMVNELVSNAIKHAFDERGSGRAHVILRCSGEQQARLEIQDDGPGLPPGFSLEDSESMGLGLIDTVVRETLGSQIRVADHSEREAVGDGVPLSGAAFRVEFATA